MRYVALILLVSWRHGRDLSGPLHEIAGYTDGRFDFVTACGLTLPALGSYASSLGISTSRSQCGDCFPRA